MPPTRVLITLLGICAIVLLSNLCSGQVKVDEDQIFTNGGFKRRVNYACKNSVLHAECAPGQVIRFLRGNYGRANTATCYHDFTAGWYCRSNSSEQIMRKKCDRKHSCRIEASNEIFGDSCPNTSKYLDMQYYCVPGASQAGGSPMKERHPKEFKRQIIYACESTQLHAQCERGKVINVLQARFGRSNAAICHQDEWHCTAGSTERIVRERCHRKRSCKIDVSNKVFGDPCPYSMKYLEMQFSCVPDHSISSRRGLTSPTGRRNPTAVTVAPTIPTSTTMGGCDDYDLNCLNFQCPEGTGNFPHPVKNNMFVFCMNWKPRADACGEGLEFLERYMTCFSKTSLFYYWLKSEENV